MVNDLDATFSRYIETLERLEAANVSNLYLVMDPYIRFKDPFSTVIGIDRVQQIFSKLFADCVDVRFVATDKYINGSQAAFAWTMRYRLRRWPKLEPWNIGGISQVNFDPVTGMAVQHIDHWDAGQFYERLPLIGPILRLIKRRIETH